MSALTEAAQVALTKCLAVQPEDFVLVVTDDVTREVGHSLREVARSLEAETMYLEHAVQRQHGEEPPIGVAEIMREMDVVLVATAKSTSHTDARRRACKAGARIATLPGITPEILERGMNIDVDALANRVRELARAVQGRSEVHITDAHGTDLRFSVEGSRVFQDTGMIRQPGDFGNLPAGKVALAPVEGSARGDLVITGSIFGARLDGEQLRVRIEGGKATNVEGITADTWAALVEEHGDPVNNLAEFGLGAHEALALSGNPLEDEKVNGTAYLAFGNNRTMGGTVDVPVHEVAVLAGPKVTLDGKTIVEEGELKL